MKGVKIMSLPEFPTDVSLTREEAINQIISSIAMEELGISHVINAEGEKLQYILGTINGATGPPPTIEDVLSVNESIRAVLQHATESQTLLRSKLQNALASSVLTGPAGPTGPSGPVTISVNTTTVTPLGPDASPTVQNEGGTENVILQFGIPRGVTGATGPTGATGVTGATGSDGATGADSLMAYSNFISNTPQIIQVNGEVALNLALSAAPVGMTFTPDTSRVTLLNAGTYRISYRIRTSSSTGASMILLHNDTTVVNSGVPALVDPGKISGVAIITADAEDTVAIGISGAGVTLSAGTSAFLDIIKIA